MTYSIQIAGDVPASAAEDDLIAALKTVVTNTEFGVTSATGTFQFAGTVDLLSTTPPPPPPPTVADAVDKLVADVTAIPNLDPQVIADIDALAGAFDAAQAVPPQVPPADPSVAPADPSTPDDPVSL